MASMILELALPALAFALGAALLWMWRRDRRALRQWRDQLLRCEHAGLEDCRRIHGEEEFPRLRGRFAGYEVEIRIIRDDASYRKLPNLWLCVALRAELDFPTLDIIAREQNTEFYALGSRLDHRLPRPPAWPEGLAMHCSAPTADLERLEQPVRDFFSDPRAKELLIMPSGVRMVTQLAQARRSEYLVLRSGLFETQATPPALPRDLLARATALVGMLARH